MRKIMARLGLLLLVILLMAASAPNVVGSDEATYKQAMTSSKKVMSDEELGQVQGAGFSQLKSIFLGKLLLVKTTILNFKLNLKSKFHGPNQTQQ